MARLEVLNPVARCVVTRVDPAPRLGDLNGGRIGLYWNQKAGGDLALRRTEAILRDRYPGARFAYVELFYRNGWTDGLPIIPPTERRVAEFLERAHLEPNRVVGEVPERSRVITAEKLAINAVMAGCLPKYMPVLVAIVETVTDPVFKFNHLASIGSPWPLILVNGPITRELGFNCRAYPFGPGARPNATIARALGLVLANCAEARSEGIQRGQWGNPLRWCGCLAENEDTAWAPLNVLRGFPRDTSTVTVVSCQPGVPYHATVLVPKPKRMLDTLCHALPNLCGAQWITGTYTLLVAPHHAEIFIREGWSKEDVSSHLMEHARVSVADLKARATWAVRWDGFSEEMLDVQPGDEARYMHLLKDNGEDQKYLLRRSHLEDRQLGIFVVVAGGNAGTRMGIAAPYAASTNPVTRAIGANSTANRQDTKSPRRDP